MPKTDWVADIRSLLRREHGKGWLIEQQSGRIKICLAVPEKTSYFHKSELGT